MKHVIVVPETDDFKHPVSHESVVWINAALGNPNLDGRDVQYLAPYWITDDFRGVNRVYHITSVSKNEDGTTVIKLGNSFVLAQPWDGVGNTRRFEYHPLDTFDLTEIEPGLLRRNPTNA